MSGSAETLNDPALAELVPTQPFVRNDAPLVSAVAAETLDGVFTVCLMTPAPREQRSAAQLNLPTMLTQERSTEDREEGGKHRFRSLQTTVLGLRNL